MYDRNKAIKIAQDEIGYLEKSKAAYQKNPAILDNKTGGAGYDNYTKYGRDMHKIYPEVMDFPAPWCDGFVDWVFYRAYGVATAKSLLGGNFDDYTVASANAYAKHNALDNTPEVGAQVFFTKNGKASGCYHTGLVERVSSDGKTITTIEGNTSAGGSGIDPNGGCVARKIRVVGRNTLFGHPNYQDKPIKGTEAKTVRQYAAVVNLNDRNSILNVRTGAGTNYPILNREGKLFWLPHGMVVSIEQEANGWGKLTGIDGWISLAKVKR